MTPSRWSTALLAVLATPTAAQLSGWLNNQVNASICTWAQPRAALIRDTVYIDGGQLRWSPGLDDGRFGPVILEKSLDGTVFTFTLNTTVKDDTNVTAALVENLINKPGGAGLKPYFLDGAMLYNDAEAFLFGGAMFSIGQAYDPPARDDVVLYQAYDVGPDKPLWKPGFYTRKTGEDVNRYVAYGAGASAPSENKAWYFSGLTSPSKGQIDMVANDNFTNWAQDVSNRMITVDMSTQNDEQWGNTTIDSSVDGRANPEMVWVPVGKEGILVVLGGVTYPQWAWTESSQQSDDPEASRNESSEFMRVIDIYDVASGDWYKQETVDGPDALTRGCAVVAVSSDQSSYNIYYYGGFDGINNDEPFNDDVWVLSLPSFTWHRINEGREIHARAGHKCFKPYADQMMVFGGYTPQAGGSTSCLEGGPVVTFNLSSGEWMDEYDPKNFDDYAVPSKVVEKIGGNGAGGATLVTPSPDGWSSRGLGEVFGESYNMDKITTFGPYNATESSERPTLPGDDDDDDDGGGGGGLPSWVAPVLGVIIGLIVIITAIVLFCLWKRRGIFKNRSSASGTEDPGMRIMSWMRGHQNEKPVTLTSTEETPSSPEMAQSHGMHHHPHYGMNSVAAGTATTTTTPGLELPPNRYEVADTQLAELHDTSPPAELPDSPLSHNDVLLKHSHLGKGGKEPSTFSSPSYSSFSFAAGADHASSISRSSAAANSNVPLTGNRDTPPAGGSTPDPEASRVTSGVSGISDTDIGHLRHVSETSIDANLASNSARGSPPPAASSSRPGFGLRGDSNTLAEETPISPPTAGDEPSEDYISARGNLVSPLRKSVFRESEEDMRKDQVDSEGIR